MEEKAKSEKKTSEGYYSLRFRSTGLGKTMLEGEPADVQIVGDMVVFHIQTTTPVRWRIRAAMSYKGLLKAIKLCFKFPVIKFLLLGFLTIKKPNLPTEF